MDQLVIDEITRNIAIHETIGVLLLLTACVSWLLMWFLLRHQYLKTHTFRPDRDSIGWTLAGKLFWEGVLDTALGLLILFSRSELPWWAIVIPVGLFASAIVLFRAYAKLGD